MQLQLYKKYTILEKASFLFVVNMTTTELQRKQVLQDFNVIDTDKDGKISRQELVSYSHTYLNDFLSDHANELFNLVDLDHSQKIDYSQFVLAAINRKRTICI